MTESLSFKEKQDAKDTSIEVYNDLITYQKGIIEADNQRNIDAEKEIEIIKSASGVIDGAKVLSLQSEIDFRNNFRIPASEKELRRLEALREECLKHNQK